MKIYELRCDANNFLTLRASDEKFFHADECDGHEKKDWVSYSVEHDPGFARKKKKMGDFTEIATSPFFSKKAVEILLHDHMENIQLLPVFCVTDQETYYLVNVLELVDCIDHEKSKVTYFSSGRVMNVERYEMKPDTLKDKYLFKRSDLPGRVPLVTEEFKERVEKYGLTGFKLELIWDSEKS